MPRSSLVNLLPLETTYSERMPMKASVFIICFFFWISLCAFAQPSASQPEPSNPLLRMDNVILSPHVASASARMDPERRRRVGQEIALVLTGRWPRSCVNPSVLEKIGLVRWQPYSMGRGPGA